MQQKKAFEYVFDVTIVITLNGNALVETDAEHRTRQALTGCEVIRGVILTISNCHSLP